MIQIDILDKTFYIQSYLKDEYVYLVSSEPDFPSIRIEFWNKEEPFSSNMKLSKEWFIFVALIDIDVLKEKLAAISPLQ